MNYRNRVAAWVCANILAERAAAPIVIPIQPFAKVVDSIHERGAQIELSPVRAKPRDLAHRKRKPLGRRLRVQRRALRKCQGLSVRYGDPLR